MKVGDRVMCTVGVGSGNYGTILQMGATTGDGLVLVKYTDEYIWHDILDLELIHEANDIKLGDYVRSQAGSTEGCFGSVIEINEGFGTVLVRYDDHKKWENKKDLELVYEDSTFDESQDGLRSITVQFTSDTRELVVNKEIDGIIYKVSVELIQE